MGAFLETLLIDLRFCVRLLRRNPISGVTAALSVAIGIGATTTIFTVANGLLLRSAEGIADPGTLVDVVRIESTGGPDVSPVSYPDYLEVRRRTTTLDQVLAMQLMLNPATLEFDGTSERIFPSVVSTNYCSALGVRPAAGRLFTPDENDGAGASSTAVLSHRYWTRRFARDPAVVGQSIRINGHPTTVIGVAAQSFRGTSVAAPDLWVPLGMIAVTEPEFGALMMTSREAEWLMLSARLSLGGIAVPGVSPPPGAPFFYLNWAVVDSGYFQTLRIPVLEGRDFVPADRNGAEPVVILGLAAVDRFWPGESGVDKFIEVHSDGRTGNGAEPVRMRVVGVVSDISDGGPPDMYVPDPATVLAGGHRPRTTHW